MATKKSIRTKIRIIDLCISTSDICVHFTKFSFMKFFNLFIELLSLSDNTFAFHYEFILAEKMAVYDRQACPISLARDSITMNDFGYPHPTKMCVTSFMTYLRTSPIRQLNILFFNQSLHHIVIEI